MVPERLRAEEEYPRNRRKRRRDSSSAVAAANRLTGAVASTAISGLISGCGMRETMLVHLGIHQFGLPGSCGLLHVEGG